MIVPQTRAECLEWDRQDPLASRRALFRLPDNVIYLDGNSLGALTAAAGQRVQDVLQAEWGHDLIQSWTCNGWLDYPARLGDRVGRLMAAAPGETLVCDSTSVNLFKLVAAASLERGKRYKIVTESGNFSTDLHILQGVARLSPDLEIKVVSRGDVLSAIDDQTFLVVLTHVHYRSAEMYDLAGVTEYVHARGARVLWDLSHSIGAVPLDLPASRADFAVGCSYKYLNGGPGAPAFLYVRHDLQGSLQPVLSGWLGDRAPFAFNDDYEPAAGIDRHRCGTPAILSYAALDGALAAFDELEMAQIREKSILLSELFIRRVESCPQAARLTLASPRDALLRGSHVSFAHGAAAEVMRRLIERGVIGDFRPPDLLRFGFTPLYLRYVDVWDAVEILADELER